MSTWTDGYVADINYTFGFYRELTPALQTFVALSRGNRGPGPGLGGPAAYCELGCGHGFSANLLAAANPNIEVYANDFLPAQIAWARSLAGDAATPNLHFSDASFQEYIDDPSLPPFDFIGLHGIYSWVSAENRQAIVDFIARKLKVGGLVYISYNTLPGWAGAMPIRRLLVEHSGMTGGPLSLRIEKAMAFAERMTEANAAYMRDTHGVKARLEGMRSHSRSYLAHEYFNRDWTPFYFADVAKELSEAKLTYLGSAHVLDHIDGVNLTPQHQAMLNEAADPVFRETVRDYLTLAQFRRDLFVRGALGMNPLDTEMAWRELRLALTVARETFELKVSGPLGDIGLHPETYNPILDALASGPKTVQQLVSDPVIKTFGWIRLQEAIKILIGSTHVQPCLDAKGDAKRAQRTKAFNAAVMKRARWSNDLMQLASPVTGGGVPVDRFQQMFILAEQEKQADPAAHVWSQLEALGQKLLKDGAAIEAPEDNLSELRERYAAFKAKALPVLQQLGIV